MTRAPYLALTPDQKQALHAWLNDHGVDHKRVPIYADFERDDTTSEWRIPVYWVDDRGRMRIDLDNNGAHVVRQHEPLALAEHAVAQVRADVRARLRHRPHPARRPPGSAVVTVHAGPHERRTR